jgi:cytidylate kinase
VALALDERGPTRLERLAGALAHAAIPLGPESVDVAVAEHPERFRVATEQVLRDVADSTGAVVLGRCGMVVLGGRPDVLSVRLDGPVDARVARAAETEGTDEAAARRSQRDVDRAREAYARAFYHVSQRDLDLYHLVIDTTVLGVETSAALVVEAATVRLGR